LIDADINTAYDQTRNTTCQGWLPDMKSKKTIAVGVLLLLVVCYVWLSDPARHTPRYQATGLNSHVHQPLPADFSDYLRLIHAMVGMARTDANADDSPLVVAENTPAESLPSASACKANADGRYENGILLIHGFLDSPYSFRTLGNYFRSKCFVVKSILLPGHGTVPGDLLYVSYQDWVDIVDYGVNNLSKQVSHVYLLGYSLGGLLAVNEAVEHPEKISRMVLISPLFKMKFAYPQLIGPYDWLSRSIPRLQWVAQHADKAEARYESFPISPVYEMQKLMGRTQQKLTEKPINIPIFVMQSAEDQTIDAQKTWDFFATNNNALSRFLWFSATSSHPPTTDSRIAVMNSDLSKQRILSMSHLSFALPESDPIYGRNGRYKDCLYYTENSPVWQQCKAGKDTYFGEVTPENLKAHVIQRLTFNPFFNDMLKQLDAFVGSNGSMVSRKAVKVRTHYVAARKTRRSPE
jgi:esterase/lipase